MILESERKMWEKEKKTVTEIASDDEIANRYDSKSEKIVTETNREKLPNFYESLKKPDYMNTRPFYQRRSRWDAKTQSRLIESILINIPIPPLFVYEVKPNVHEVMDGQQRISAIKAFYSNELVLDGLERWPELNGRTYNSLPQIIKDGIDRRSITWISVLPESTDNEEDAMLLKQLVFERLNTGGVELGHQEIRNALFASTFNQLLVDLSRGSIHRKAWGLPEYDQAELTSTPEALKKNSFYQKMEDVEVILRFFALRHSQHYQKGMRNFLDLYMVKSRKFFPSDIAALKVLYESVISTAYGIYGQYTFCVYDTKKNYWSKKQKAFADAVMIGVANNIDSAHILVKKSEEVVEKTRQLFIDHKDGILTGRANTKQDVINRLELVTAMMKGVL